jgi:ribose transport system ATP-binding protein
MAEAVNAPRFEMRGVRKAFGATVALDAVDCAVRAGEVCALVGQNGAGKSTLMAILAGALAPDAGAMRLDGAAYAPRNPLDARRAGVAMIYQELSLAPHLSVMENILLGVEPVRRGIVQRNRMREIAAGALRELGHADISPDALVGDLPPAAQQLVEIARALAVGCRVLVLDEPTSSLGQADVRALFDLIGRLKARGIAIVYISHFIEEVKAVSDRFVVLRDGRNAGGGVTADAAAADIVGLMVGRPLDDLYPRGARTPGEPILMLDDVVPGAATLALRRGEILGIAGLQGSGQVELVEALAGVRPLTAGAVRMDGRDIGGLGVRARRRVGIGHIPADRRHGGLVGDLSVAENLALPIAGEARFSRFGVLRRGAVRDHALELIERFGVRTSGPSVPVSTLSGGNQQKVVIARELWRQPSVVLSCYPTWGLDFAATAAVHEELRRQRDAGAAVLLASMDLDELLSVADRILVMQGGRVVGAVDADADGAEEIGLLMGGAAR